MEGPGHRTDQRPTPAPDSLGRLVQQALVAGTTDVLGLREEVCEYVRQAKCAGAPPEYVLRALKEVVAAAPTLRDGICRTDLQPPRRVFDAITKWCIEQYYRAD